MSLVKEECVFDWVWMLLWKRSLASQFPLYTFCSLLLQNCCCRCFRILLNVTKSQLRGAICSTELKRTVVCSLAPYSLTLLNCGWATGTGTGRQSLAKSWQPNKQQCETNRDESLDGCVSAKQGCTTYRFSIVIAISTDINTWRKAATRHERHEVSWKKMVEDCTLFLFYGCLLYSIQCSICSIKDCWKWFPFICFKIIKKCVVF